MLGEPTNDLDTDMLAAMEDLLDTWPGTLIVVSHDRYLLERVTDQQYAVIGGTLRHLPGGVDEYLQLRRAEERGGGASKGSNTATAASAPALSGPELHAARKEVNAIERKLQKLQEETERIHAQMADHDQSDFEGLGKLTTKLQAAESEAEELELRWLELSEQLEG